MQTMSTILISPFRAEGTPQERIEQSARSLLRELNEVSPESASFPPSGPAPTGAMPGEMAMMMQVVLSVGTMASTAAVPVIAHWLSRQPADTGLKLAGVDAAGAAYEVTISPGTPTHVVHQLAGAVMNGATNSATG